MLLLRLLAFAADPADLAIFNKIEKRSAVGQFFGAKERVGIDQALM